jgi:hypothetical protein
MDELTEVQRLLAEPPPGPDVVEAARLRLEHATLGRTPPRARAAGRGGRAPGLVRRDGGPRRWPGWLTPVAAAAAVVAAIIASLAVSGAIARHNAGAGPANSSGALTKVPRYFIAVPEGPGRAVVGATATGAVLGTVAPPQRMQFRALAAAGDGRTFVLAAGVPPQPGTNALDWGPVRFYRLVLDRSGHPGRLAALPTPPETATITGLALSHDGSKLAVAQLPAHGRFGPKIQVFSLAGGAGREWVWPGTGSIGQISLGVSSGEMSWGANNRTLLFEETTSRPWIPQLRLLDTAAPAGSLRAASTRVPISSAELGEHGDNIKNPPFQISGTPLMTADGTKLVATTYHEAAPPNALAFTITQFSVRTGEPVQVLYRLRADSDENSPGLYWVNTSGTAMIAVRTLPGQHSRAGGTVFGVQTRTTFTPLPPSTQRLFVRDGSLSRLPAW